MFINSQQQIGMGIQKLEAGQKLQVVGNVKLDSLFPSRSELCVVVIPEGGTTWHQWFPFGMTTTQSSDLEGRKQTLGSGPE